MAQSLPRLSRHRVAGAVAVAASLMVCLLLPIAPATVVVEPEPVIDELDRLGNKDQPISLQLENVSAAEALNAIAAAGDLHFSMEEPADCCRVNIRAIDVPVRRALEILAAQTDARYRVVNADTLRVLLPQLLIPGGEDEITMPVAVRRVEPVYPKDARDARAGGRVTLMAVIRDDGTVGSVTVLSRAEGWPSLDEAAIEAVRKRTYRPGMKNGRPVSVYYTVSVQFELR